MGVEWEADSTHYDKDSDCFYKKVDEVWMLHLGNDEWMPSDSLVNGETDPETLTAR